MFFLQNKRKAEAEINYIGYEEQKISDLVIIGLAARGQFSTKLNTKEPLQQCKTISVSFSGSESELSK